MQARCDCMFSVVCVFLGVQCVYLCVCVCVFMYISSHLCQHVSDCVKFTVILPSEECKQDVTVCLVWYVFFSWCAVCVFVCVCLCTCGTCMCLCAYTYVSVDCCLATKVFLGKLPAT